jgi:hypothetical protein
MSIFSYRILPTSSKPATSPMWLRPGAGEAERWACSVTRNRKRAASSSQAAAISVLRRRPIEERIPRPRSRSSRPIIRAPLPIADSLRRTVVLNGSALDQNMLVEADIQNADLMVALTNDDQVNILSSVMAKRLGCKANLALINNPSYHDLYQDPWHRRPYQSACSDDLAGSAACPPRPYPCGSTRCKRGRRSDRGRGAGNLAACRQAAAQISICPTVCASGRSTATSRC